MTTADLAPIGFQATPEGMTPCAVCGIPTTGPTTDYPVFSRVVATAAGERADTMPKGASVALPTCSDCRDIEASAAAIVAAHPGLRRALGSVAAWQTTTALYGLSALGQPLPGQDIAPARLRDLVHRLAAPGAVVAYSRRFSPVWLADSATKLAARTPWSAVELDALAECRAAAVEWLADARPARPLAHPNGEHCAWCGTATAMGRRTSEAWIGKLCATCADVQSGGGTSDDALWQAVDPDRAIRRRMPRRPRIDGATPWRQRRGGNGAPWSHLGGVEALRRDVARLVGVTL
ncbi:hypothetical protein GCM10025760_34350 [Microbacterium yannicii]|uniref:Uncharacterized protein n=1 Tax=Microbacterium yannicii TaxID=671622 RepID=A0ABP9MMG2_9MICO|nr:hypothetical protein [Microbacterium yannicii]MCO5951899.1 hypothetical protein [Microbacterium yannicii]